jgi:GNAT superfamily N-acetyltransferase
MVSDTIFRPMAATDGEALAELSRACPDTGLVRASVRYEIDPYLALAALRPETIGLCADAPGSAGLAGTACVSFSECEVEGRRRPCALFHSLMIHPHHRKRGLASDLTRQCVALARARLGPEGVIFAHVQDGNAGSLKAIGRSLPQRGGLLAGCVVWTRRRAPAPRRDLVVRRVEPRHFEAMAAQLNAFYRDYDLFTPQTAESIRRRLDATPLDRPLRHGYVVTDRAGNLLAGLSIIAQCWVRTLEVHAMPALMRLANRVLHVLPPDRILRQLAVERVWFAPGQVPAARLLWETIRWEWRDRGDAMICVFDPRSPVRELFDIPRWLPRTSTTVLLDAEAKLGERRLLYPHV